MPPLSEPFCELLIEILSVLEGSFDLVKNRTSRWAIKISVYDTLSLHFVPALFVKAYKRVFLVLWGVDLVRVG